MDWVGGVVVGSTASGWQKLQNVTPCFEGINKITHAYFSLLTGRDTEAEAEGGGRRRRQEE